MNAFRKISLVVLFAVVAVFAFGVSSPTAEAGHHGHGHHHHHHGHFHVKHPSYVHYDTYWPSQHFVKPLSYPVTYYDCYGRPYIVWQTSYGTNPLW
jgi:hypothetical protein